MSFDLFDLRGRTALVTGAASGIGAAIAASLASAGADVACHGNTRSPDATRQAIESLGRRAIALRGDVRNPGAPGALVDATIEAFGRLDILVNNAGMSVRAPSVDFSDEDWDQVLAVNLTSVFRLCRQAARQMLARPATGRRGTIINIASLLSFQGGITVPAYAAAKGGVAQLTKALANEWAPQGIHVNAIAPGYISTDLTHALQHDEVRGRQILERIPVGRWGDPVDLGGAAVFLASAASDYVHGHVLIVDGGWMGR